jgi:hypothetical protein
MNFARSLVPSPAVLAEWALSGSLISKSETLPQADGPALRHFWATQRRLQHAWLADLRHCGGDLAAEAHRFERVALENFLTELLTRVWATNWSIADRLRANCDSERVLLNVLQGIARVRREVLLLMVGDWDGPATDMISRVDRFRRRCERWTDLLVAGPGSRHGMWDFAVEPDRARDFGRDRNGGAESAAASLLISAGLRVMFASRWPSGCCEGPHFAALLTTITSTLRR